MENPYGTIPPPCLHRNRRGPQPARHGQRPQGSRPSTPNAIVALVCARGGNMPADCSQSPLIGRWAGKRVLVQGDYAENDDTPNWEGPAVPNLYTAMMRADQRKPWDGMPDGYWDNIPV